MDETVCREGIDGIQEAWGPNLINNYVFSTLTKPKKKTFMYLGHICLLSLPQYSIFFPTNIYTILTKKKKKKNIRCANLEEKKESTRLERCVSQFGTRVIAAPKRAIQHLFGITCLGLLGVSLTFEIINKVKSGEFILKVIPSILECKRDKVDVFYI